MMNIDTAIDRLREAQAHGATTCWGWDDGSIIVSRANDLGEFDLGYIDGGVLTFTERHAQLCRMPHDRVGRR